MPLRSFSNRFMTLLAIAMFTFTLSTFAADNPTPQAISSAFEGSSQLDSLEPVVEIPEGSFALTGLAFRISEAVDVQNPLVVTVFGGEKTIARETIALPASSSPASAIISQFLGNHPEELLRIREMNEARPGLLRFNVTTGDKVLIDVPFSAADSMSTELAAATPSILGQSQLVDIHLREPRKVTALGMQPEPECEAACNATYIECYYELCDQRGDCSYCWSNYQYCVAGCPQICVEPKQTYTWKTSWMTVGSSLQEWCKMPGAYKYVFQTTYQSRNVYKRTVHCDGTYTDTYQTTERQQTVCKVYVGGSCGFAPIWTTALPPTCNL